VILVSILRASFGQEKIVAEIKKIYAMGIPPNWMNLYEHMGKRYGHCRMSTIWFLEGGSYCIWY
jgi:hypothetical protein